MGVGELAEQIEISRKGIGMVNLVQELMQGLGREFNLRYAV